MAGVALEQRCGMQQEGQEHAVGLGEVKRALQRMRGGAGVAERVAGGRLEQEGLQERLPCPSCGRRVRALCGRSSLRACGPLWGHYSNLRVAHEHL
jgi:hypothetical protein